MIEDYKPIYIKELDNIREQLTHINYETKEFDKLIEERNRLEKLEEENRQKFIDSKLDLPITLSSEPFWALEGETLNQGLPVKFIRFQGCGLNCLRCDSKYTFKDSPTTTHLTLRELLENIKSDPYKKLAITGGEPLIHKEEVYWLLWFLSYEGRGDNMHLERFSDYDITIETNGAVDISPFLIFHNFVHFIGDWKCPNAFGKKANEAMLESNLKLYTKRDALKFVITEEDFSEVEKVLNMDISSEWSKKPLHVDETTNVYLSPCFGQIDLKKMSQWIIDHRNQYKVRMQIQQHKIIFADDLDNPWI